MTVKEQLLAAWGPYYDNWLALAKISLGSIRYVVIVLPAYSVGQAAIFLLKDGRFVYMDTKGWKNTKIFADTLEELTWIKLDNSCRVRLGLGQVRKPDEYHTLTVLR